MNKFHELSKKIIYVCSDSNCVVKYIVKYDDIDFENLIDKDNENISGNNLKEFIIDKKIYSRKEIKDLFINNFGNVKYKISHSDTEDMINKYKSKYKKEKKENIKIEEIINLDRQINWALTYVNRLYNN